MRASGFWNAQVCLSLSNDEELRELNRIYAQEDHATDVLSFSQSLPHQSPAAEQLLGDIIISVETAQRQADVGRRALMDELLHLAVHGFCHLLGYDHATPEEEKVMFGYEAELRILATQRGPVYTLLPPLFDSNANPINL